MTIQDSRPQPLQTIRLMLLLGVLMFGAVIVVVHRKPDWQPGMLPAVYEYVLVAYSVVVVAVAVMLRSRVAQEPEPQQRGTMLLVGWAFGESAALGGAIIYFVNGQMQWYLLGLIAMLVSLGLLSPSAASGDAADVNGRG